MTSIDEKYKGISTRIRVLVVDNNKETRKSICDILEQAGYIVRAAEGMGEVLIKEAIALAQQLRPHVAVIDLRIDGSGILNHLRPNRSWRISSNPVFKRSQLYSLLWVSYDGHPT